LAGTCATRGSSAGYPNGALMESAVGLGIRDQL
jgi:hypothetical protein